MAQFVEWFVRTGTCVGADDGRIEGGVNRQLR